MKTVLVKENYTIHYTDKFSFALLNQSPCQKLEKSFLRFNDDYRSRPFRIRIQNRYPRTRANTTARSRYHGTTEQ